ncbi:MAG: hypothetical protein HYY16_17870 [Planctomycetes bacterium]|nr:hypothetical protein [Planctomycetota bacterium]
MPVAREALAAVRSEADAAGVQADVWTEAVDLDAIQEDVKGVFLTHLEVRGMLVEHVPLLRALKIIDEGSA